MSFLRFPVSSMGKADLDYSYTDMRDLGGVHRFSLLVIMSQARRHPRLRQKALDRLLQNRNPDRVEHDFVALGAAQRQ